VLGQVAIVTFKSDSSVTGEGFVLNYIRLTPITTTDTPETLTLSHLGIPTIPTTAFLPLNHTYDYDDFSNSSTSSSNDSISDTEFQYINSHARRRNSSFTYPRNSAFAGLGKNEILTLTYSPEPGRLESFDRMGTEVTIKQLHLKLDESCQSDTVRFYERNVSDFLSVRSYKVDDDIHTALVDPLPCSSHEDVAWICEDCDDNQQTRTQQLTFKTLSPGFVLVFKSVADKESSQPFSVEWKDYFFPAG
jgi:hypothetical protein